MKYDSHLAAFPFFLFSVQIMKYRAERNKTLFEYSPKDGATASATLATEKSGVSVGSSSLQTPVASHR